MRRVLCIVVAASLVQSAVYGQDAGAALHAPAAAKRVAAQPLPSAWPDIHAALDLLAALAEEVPAAEGKPASALPLFETVYVKRLAESEGEAELRRAIAGVAQLEATGFFARLTDLRGGGFGPPRGDEGPNWEFRRLGDLRTAARACAARMHLAAEAGEFERATESFEHLLLLGRAGMMLDGIGYLVGIAITSLAEERARAMLFERTLEPLHLRAMLDAWLRQSALTPFEVAIARDLRVFQRELPGFFRHDGQADRDRLREWGLDVPRSQKLADREETEAFVEAHIARVLEAAKRPIWEALPALEAIDQEEHAPSFAIADLLRTSSSMLQRRAVVDVRRGGLRLMLALELLKAECGAYPKELAELVPAYLPSLPLDSFSGAHYIYRRLDAERDPHGRGYLLYSIGPDRVDNGGRGHIAGVYAAGRARRGVDLVINERPEEQGR